MFLYINKIFLVFSALFSFLISCNSQSEVIIEDSVLKPEIYSPLMLSAKALSYKSPVVPLESVLNNLG